MSAESHAKFKNEKKMATAHRAAVVLLVKELSNDSILKEAISCEDEESSRAMSALRIILNVLNHSTDVSVIFAFQELQSAV